MEIAVVILRESVTQSLFLLNYIRSFCSIISVEAAAAAAAISSTSFSLPQRPDTLHFFSLSHPPPPPLFETFSPTLPCRPLKLSSNFTCRTALRLAACCSLAAGLGLGSGSGLGDGLGPEGRAGCSLAYCAQQPPMHAGTLRDNILMGLPLDHKR